MLALLLEVWLAGLSLAVAGWIASRWLDGSPVAAVILTAISGLLVLAHNVSAFALVLPLVWLPCVVRRMSRPPAASPPAAPVVGRRWRFIRDVRNLPDWTETSAVRRAGS